MNKDYKFNSIFKKNILNTLPKRLNMKEFYMMQMNIQKHRFYIQFEEAVMQYLYR